MGNWLQNHHLVLLTVIASLIYVVIKVGAALYDQKTIYVQVRGGLDIKFLFEWMVLIFLPTTCGMLCVSY